MPLKSKAQMGKFFAMEKRGELPKGTAKKWAEHTPNISKLPAKVHTTISPSAVGNEELFRMINKH